MAVRELIACLLRVLVQVRMAICGCHMFAVMEYVGCALHAIKQLVSMAAAFMRKNLLSTLVCTHQLELLREANRAVIKGSEN